MLRDSAKQIIIAVIVAILSFYITKVLQEDDVVIVEESLKMAKSLEFTLRCKQAKFDKFGFSIDFGKTIRQGKVRSSSSQFTIPDSCLVVDKSTLYFEIAKSLAFVYGQELSFAVEFVDSLTIPETGFKISMYGDLLFAKPNIFLFEKKAIIPWLKGIQPLEVILFSLLFYIIIVAGILQRRRKRVHNLIKEYSARLDEGEYRIWFIDFLMLKAISRTHSATDWHAESLLDSLIDKASFINAHIAPLPKSGVVGKLLPGIGNEALYIRIRNNSIREIIKQNVRAKRKTSVKLNTVAELRAKMTMLVRKRTTKYGNL